MDATPAYRICSVAICSAAIRHSCTKAFPEDPKAARAPALPRTGEGMALRYARSSIRFTTSVFAFPQFLHSKVSRSWPGTSGSMRAIIIVAPHFGHGGRGIALVDACVKYGMVLSCQAGAQGALSVTDARG
jgi:hypothetical protein